MARWRRELALEDARRVELSKAAPASRGYGRGIDNTYTPARWNVTIDGTRRYTVFARPQRYMDIPQWEISDVNGRPVGSLYRSRNEAITFLLNLKGAENASA